MVEIRCVGVNEHNLHPQEFIEQFIAECKLQGYVLAVRSNGKYAAAMVIRND